MHKPSGGSDRRLSTNSSVLTILLVEDDSAVRELVTFLLKLEGYETLATDRGDNALQLGMKYQGRIHLLLADVMLPGMRGDKLAERLLAVRPDVRVLFMSGHMSRDVLRPGNPLGQAHFIRKPFSPAVLARTVKEALKPLAAGSRGDRSTT